MNTKHFLASLLLWLACWHAPLFAQIMDVDYTPATRTVMSYNIRNATDNNVTIFTALDTVKVLLDVLEETTLTISTIDA